jgi:hypothetical protein
MSTGNRLLILISINSFALALNETIQIKNIHKIDLQNFQNDKLANFLFVISAASEKFLYFFRDSRNIIVSGLALLGIFSQYKLNSELKNTFSTRFWLFVYLIYCGCQSLIIMFVTYHILTVALGFQSFES